MKHFQRTFRLLQEGVIIVQKKKRIKIKKKRKKKKELKFLLFFESFL